MGLAEREAEMQELETSRPGRSRDLFGVQLEVTFIIFKLYSHKFKTLTISFSSLSLINPLNMLK